MPTRSKPHQKNVRSLAHSVHYAIEPLERRLLLSSIVWVNEGTTSNDTDGFDSVFGSNATLARSVVNAAITSWEQVIFNFNYSGGGDTYNMTINMATTGVSQGANANPTHYNNSKPDQGTMTIGRGLDTNGDGLGDGGGYFLDPTVIDPSAFGFSYNNAFAGYANSTSPASGKADLYELVLHELGHAMGLLANSTMDALSTDTGVPDNIDTATAPYVGDFWLFQSGGFATLRTGFNSAGQTGGNPTDAHGPEHAAPPGASATVNGVTYVGTDDLMTPFYIYGQRRLISDNDAKMLQLAYGYSITLPDTFGTWYDTLSSTGVLNITPSPFDGGNGTVTLSEIGSGILSVSLLLGNPAQQMDPTSFFTNDFNQASITTINLYGGAGNDTFNILQLPGITINIYGKGGTDALDVDGAYGTTTLTATTLIGPGQNITFQGITNFSIMGTTGNDIFDVVSFPYLSFVTINGETGNDTLNYGSSTGADIYNANPMTWNGGGGTDTIVIQNLGGFGDYQYTVNNGALLVGDTIGNVDGTIDFSNTANIQILGDSDDDTFQINAIPAGLTVTCVGNDGNDVLYVGNPVAGLAQFSDMKGTVDFYGDGGYDSVYLSDRDAGASHTYNVFANSPSITSDTSGPVVYDATTEYVELDGPTGYGSVYDVNSTAAGATVKLFGGLGDDTFNVTAASTGFYNIAGQVEIDGGGGTNIMYYNENTYTGSDAESISLTQTDIEQDTNAAVDYSLINSLVINGPALNIYYYILGTSPDITGQTTLYCGNGNDIIYLFAHDVNGNRTLASTIGIAGQGGTDTFNIADQGFTDPVHYVLSNPYGSSTQDITGLGTADAPSALIGIGSDVENINILAGDADDTFDIDSFETGAALTIDGNGGNDTLNLTPSTGNVAANITDASNINAITFDGGTGDNAVQAYNGASTTAWTYTETSSIFKAQKTSYSLTMNLTNVNYLYAISGTAADVFLIQSTPSTYYNASEFDSAGGADSFTIGNASSTQSIYGSILLQDSTDAAESATIDDSADTTGRTFHVESTTISGVSGDNLLGAGGYIGLVGFTGSISIKAGSGADTVYAQPNANASISITGGSPTSAPGDSLTLALANAVNYVVHGTASSGSVTSDNLKTLTYSGFETGPVVDATSPQVTAWSFDNGDAASSPPSLTATFNEQLLADPGTGALQLLDIVTGNIVSVATSTNYNAGAATETFIFGNGLAPGIYQATIPAGSAYDVAGNPSIASSPYTFLYVPDAQSLALAPDAPPTTVQQISLGVGSTVDLANDEIIAPISIASVQSILKAGQIFTSTAGGTVGYADLGGGQTEITYALPGDTNLDGIVNFTDLLTVASDYGLTGSTWTAGDFNYDGSVNFSDLLTLATNYGASIDGPAAAPVSNFSALWAKAQSQAAAQPPAPTHLAFIESPATTINGKKIHPSLIVAVEDAAGNIVKTNNSKITLSIAHGPKGAALTGTLTARVVNGIATFTNLTLNKKGHFDLRAIDGSLTSADFNLTVI